MSQDKQFCGCCGGEMESQTQIWCGRCEKHVTKDLAFWEATWYAQTGKYCPFTTTQFVPFGKKELKVRGLL
jgi:predicted amidophosphoribosyltransferase